MDLEEKKRFFNFGIDKPKEKEIIIGTGYQCPECKYKDMKKHGDDIFMEIYKCPQCGEKFRKVD